MYWYIQNMTILFKKRSYNYLVVAHCDESLSSLNIEKNFRPNSKIIEGMHHGFTVDVFIWRKTEFQPFLKHYVLHCKHKKRMTSRNSLFTVHYICKRKACSISTDSIMGFFFFWKSSPGSIGHTQTRIPNFVEYSLIYLVFAIEYHQGVILNLLRKMFSVPNTPGRQDYRTMKTVESLDSLGFIPVWHKQVVV